MNENHENRERLKERMTVLAWLRNYRWSMRSEQQDAIDDVINEIERGTHLQVEPVAEMLMDLERLPADDQQTTETLAAIMASCSKTLVEFLERYSGLGAHLVNAARLSRLPLSAVLALRRVTMKAFPDDPKALWAERIYARLLREIENELSRRARLPRTPGVAAAELTAHQYESLSEAFDDAMTKPPA